MTDGRITEPYVAPVDLATLLARVKYDVMSSMFCVHVGTIVSYNQTINTASISINSKKQFSTGQIGEYPVLGDCPVFMLSSGSGPSSAQISMPVNKGDQCIVLFNDRCIDQWWVSGAAEIPESARMHSIADGIALVGIRNLKTVKFTPANSICIDGGSKKVAIKNTSANLKTILLKLIDCILAIQVIDIGTPAAPAGTWGLTGTTGPSGLATLKTDIANLLDEGLT